MPQETLHLLLIDEVQQDAEALFAGLLSLGEPVYRLTHVTNLEDALAALDADRSFDLVLLDFSLTGAAGLEGFYGVRVRAPDLPIVLLTRIEDQELALQALALGAQDFLRKDRLGPAQLSRALLFAIERQRRLVVARAATERPVIDLGRETKAAGQAELRIANYTIVRLLGEGASSSVYEARRLDDPDGKAIALKLYKPPAAFAAAPWQAWQASFLREAELAVSIVDDHVVRILDYGTCTTTNSPYLAMEYVDGLPLDRCESQLGPLDYAAKVAILCQAARGLGAIHARAIRHGDIKPENLLVDRDGKLRIADFGIATWVHEPGMPDELLLGSPAYMAPELFTGEGADHRADLFSLGVVAYEWLLGCRPFNAQALARIIRQIKLDRPPDPRKRDRDFPETLSAILACLLRKSPNQRYRSADELRTDLEGYLAGRSPATAPTYSRLTHWLHHDWA